MNDIDPLRACIVILAIVCGVLGFGIYYLNTKVDFLLDKVVELDILQREQKLNK